MQWAVINREPYRLHESRQHLELTEETWFQMDVVERESYVDVVLSSDVSLTKARDGSRLSATPTSQASADVVNAPKDGNNALSLLANVAPVDNLEREEGNEVVDDLFVQSPILGMSADELTLAFTTIPASTVEGMWQKAEWLLKTPGQVVNAPGCATDARMVASRRAQDGPHFVSPGKAEGEFRCDRSCPQWNGLAVCSHVLAAALSAGKLQSFIHWYQHSKVQKKQGNLTSLARTDMPSNPGRKGRQSNARLRH